MANHILVTGANGMVGRNLLEHEAMVSESVFSPLRGELDLSDLHAVRAYIRRHRPTTVIHAAGRVGGIAANMNNQATFLAENVQIGINLASIAAEEGVARFLNLSSSCVYPRIAENPLRESSLFGGPVEPTNEGYALGKLTVLRYGELLAAQVDSFAWVSLIPCNLYGRWDHFDEDRSHLVPAVIRKLDRAVREGRDEVEIWGSGEVRREFMLASDLASLIMAALRDFHDLPKRVNVGVGTDYTVNQYYRIAAEVVGYQGEFTHALQKPSGMPRKQVDTSVQTELGWPDVTELRRGLEITYAFFLEHVLH